MRSSALAFAGSSTTLPLSEDVQPPLPAHVLYGAAKASGTAFVRALAGELAGGPVTVTVVCPGVVSTGWNGGVGRSTPTAMSAEDVAAAAWAAHRAGEVLCVPALEDLGVLDRLREAELELLRSANAPRLASRYRDALS